MYKQVCCLAVCLTVLMCSLTDARGPADRPFVDPSGRAAVAKLLARYDRHRLPRTSPEILLPVKNYYFHGKARHFNRFLAEFARLSGRVKVRVSLTGPSGLNLGVPLTPGAAQAGVAYDWCVQDLADGGYNIVVPLAARIPFSEIQVPAAVPVGAGLGAPEAAESFARLHNGCRKRPAGSPSDGR